MEKRTELTVRADVADAATAARVAEMMALFMLGLVAEGAMVVMDIDQYEVEPCDHGVQP